MAKRYELTPARRRSILQAQRKSARKRGMIGKMLGAGVKKTVNAASLGASGKLTQVLDPNSQRNIRRNAKLRRINAAKRPRWGNG